MLLPVSELAISLINLVRHLAGHARGSCRSSTCAAGIPGADRTMVVVPAIIDSEARLTSLLDDLEVRFLANRDPHLHFALLTDFADADRADQPGRRRARRARRAGASTS